MKKLHLSQFKKTGRDQRTFVTDKNPIASPELLWTARTAASYCGFESPVTILRQFRAGRLRGYRLTARAVRFDPDDVKAWIAAARVNQEEVAR
jgi:hypothetical protein